VKRPVAILAISAFVFTGCSTIDNDESTKVPAPTFSESASPSPTEETQQLPTPLELWQQALDNTAQANAAAIEVQLITNVEGFERIVAGAGYVELAPAFGDITWTDDLGTTREVITANGHFLELDDTWLELSGDSTLPTTVAFNPLAGLGGATNVVEVGTEDVEGVPTIRLDADLSPSDGTLIMGFSQEEMTVFGETDEASLIATMWIDTEGQIVRVLREFQTSSLDGDPISATSLYLLTDIGQVQPIDVPATVDAIPAPV
jgi:hypothetical protein